MHIKKRYITCSISTNNVIRKASDPKLTTESRDIIKYTVENSTGTNISRNIFPKLYIIRNLIANIVKIIKIMDKNITAIQLILQSIEKLNH